MKLWDFVIVGSGISSLTSAALLSKHGHSVCVLEEYIKPGGYMHSFNRFGCQFETGAHYVGGLEPDQPFYALLKYIDVYDADLFVELDPEGFDEMRFPTFQFQFSKGYEKNISKLTHLFPQEANAIRSYFDTLSETSKLFPLHRINENKDQNRLHQAITTSLKTVVEGLTSNADLQNIFYSYCVLHGVEPKDVSFGLHAILSDSLITGAYGLRNGGNSLAEKFVTVIQRSGGEVRTNCEVKKLSVSHSRVTSVETSQGEIFTRRIISGIHPKATFSMIDQDLIPPLFRERLRGVKESAGIFGIYAVGSTPPPLDRLKNYYLFCHSDNSESFLKTREPMVPDIFFLSRPDRGSLDDGKKRFPLIIHCSGEIDWFSEWRDTKYGRRPKEYEERKLMIAERAISRINESFPGLKNWIERFTTSTPLSNIHFNGSLEGSSYGIYHSMDHTGFRALGPPTHFENLYLTGQSTVFPGLQGAAISGLQTVSHILGNRSILTEVNEAREMVAT